MIIQLDINGRLRLAAPDDFGRLHCEFVQSSAHLSEVRAWLAGAVELESADIAWIQLSWLRLQAPKPEWMQDLDRMIARASPFGWVSPDGQRVKAHVVWADTAQQRP